MFLSFLQHAVFFREDLEVEIGYFDEIRRLLFIGGRWRVGFKIGGNEVGVCGQGTTANVFEISIGRNARVFATPLGVLQEKVLDVLEDAKVFLKVLEGFPVAQAFQNAALDGGTNSAQHVVGLFLVTHMGGSGVLNQNFPARLRMGPGVEAAESARGGEQIEPAVFAGLKKLSDDFLVGVFGAEIEDQLTILSGKAGELVAFFHGNGGAANLVCSSDQLVFA